MYFLKMSSLKECFWKSNLKKCIFWGSNFKKVFFEGAIFKKYFVREQSWKFIFWRGAILTLIWVGGNFTPLRWFFLNNLEMVKAVTLAFCSISNININSNIHRNIIRYICAKFGICNLPQSPDIGQNTDVGISKFRISGLSVINKSFHNSRTNHDMDMKLGPVTKNWQEKHNNLKKIDDDFMLANYDVFAFFPIYGKFAAIRKRILNAWSIKLTFSLKIIFIL